MKIGGHLSIAGGHHNALDSTINIGGNSLQIFSSSPRNWGVSPIDKEHIRIFIEKKNKLNIDPVYFHASYLINFADSGRIGHASIKTLSDELKLADKMQIKGSIIHLGSFKQETKPTTEQYGILFKNISKVLENTPENTLFIIENAGNKKLCWSLDELGHIVKSLKNQRVKVCIDTCHLWGAGYDLSDNKKFQQYFEEFDKKVGIESLEVFQINDSRDPLGSFRDRHENLGFGQIPEEEFRILANNPLTKNYPFILEVPGLDKNGPDKENITRFKNYENV